MHDHAMVGDSLLAGSLFLTGLAASLHCVGMCGPILIAFSNALNDDGRPRFFDLMLFHAGRLWTYALLGAFAGFSGAALSGISESGRLLALGLGFLILLGGLAAWGAIPGWKLQTNLPTCVVASFRSSGAWLRRGGPLGRLLMGAAQGFVPCGMVYAMLAASAALSHPLASAGAMLAFGLGTLPLLTATMLGLRMLPHRIRLAGPRIAATSWIVVGLVVTLRAW